VVIASTASTVAQATVECPVPFNGKSCSAVIGGLPAAPVCFTVFTGGGQIFRCDLTNASMADPTATIVTSGGGDYVLGFGTVDGQDFCCYRNSSIYAADLYGAVGLDTFLSFYYDDGTNEFNQTSGTSPHQNRAYGNTGNDIIGGSHSTTVRDDLYGGLGDDTIDGWEGDDVLYGEGGNDTIKGWAGNDTLDGGIGDDVMNGDDGDDSVNGGAGNDIVCGGYMDTAGDFLVDGDTNSGVDKLWGNRQTGSHATCQASNAPGQPDTTKWDGNLWTPGGAIACLTANKISVDPGCP